MLAIFHTDQNRRGLSSNVLLLDLDGHSRSSAMEPLDGPYYHFLLADHAL